MTAAVEMQRPTKEAVQLDYDAIIIGAGVSGLYQLYRLRELGMKVLTLERGSNIGGTWYWNRYPGARFDSESWTYNYFFSDELLQEWKWSEHFAPQPETERYLHYVADKFDLHRDIKLKNNVLAAHYHEDIRGWEVVLQDGKRYRCRFLVTAIGILSAPTLPRIVGIDSFRGQAFHTARWPKETVSFEGKRVAVIGTGATGVQIIQEVSKTAKQLTVFQRTPNWCAPLHNSKITEEEMARIRDRYPEIIARCLETPACFVHGPDPRSALEATPQEREAFFEQRYSEPGFGIWYGNFRDILVDREANALITDFMERKIRQRVKDPAVAEKLVPKNHGFGTRRVPLETNYYEVYNQPNVKLIDVKETPIERITPYGIKTSEAEDEFDLIVYASGFDAITGSFDRIDFRGIGGRRLKDAWSEGPETYMGFLTVGFPNMLMVMGPNGGFGNFPRLAEYNTNWVTGLLRFAWERGLTRIEATEVGTKKWYDHAVEMSKGMLSSEIDSWMTGVNSNVEGKNKRQVIRYTGGFPSFREHCDTALRNNYEDIKLDK